MLSLPFSTALHSSPSRSLPLRFRSRRCLLPRFTRLASGPSDQSEDHHQTALAGFRLEEVVDRVSDRSRLDAWISSRIPGASRARIQSSIRQGLVSINDIAVDKVSHKVKVGDKVNCVVSELKPLRAKPEEIPLNIVYEDNHVLVVNKPAHMVVHPAPGNSNGTLVNAILHHCRLPATVCASDDVISETEDLDSCDFYQDNIFALKGGCYEASVRPGIVHRLDKGTSGLLVVAKDEHAHGHLAEQFKNHTIHRVYISLTCGVPSSSSARVNVPVARDPNNRLRMAAVGGSYNISHARHAVSRYRVLEVLAGGGSALVEWRLETGRTHQIRAHAKYLGIPLLGDEVYGGTKSFALSLLKPKVSSYHHSHLLHILSTLQRPCLHALTLGFNHPHTGIDLNFTCPPPPDFAGALKQLRCLRSIKL